MKGTIGFIGGGNMAAAILGGLIRKGVCEPPQILVGEISEERRRILEEEFGVRTSGDNRQVIGEATGLLLAIKPQGLSGMATEVKTLFPNDKPLVSILAGTTVARLRHEFNGHNRIVRTMPNLPALVGKGVTGIAGTAATLEEDLRFAETLLGAVGTTVRVPEEALDAVTATSGSGPGYLFRIAALMIESARKLGLSEEQATELVTRTIDGSAALLASSGETAEELCRKVCSPGGTTLAGLEAMMEQGLGNAIEAGLHAACERSKQLSEG